VISEEKTNNVGGLKSFVSMNIVTVFCVGTGVVLIVVGVVVVFVMKRKNNNELLIQEPMYQEMEEK